MSGDVLPPLLEGGLPDYVDSYYWLVGVEMVASSPNYACYVSALYSPSETLSYAATFNTLLSSGKFADMLVDVELCVASNNGTRSSPIFSLSTCQSKCASYPLTMGKCPINLAGCCDCPRMSFKNDPNSGALDWILVVGWVDLALWSMLILLMACFASLAASYKKSKKASSVALPLEAKSEEDSEAGGGSFLIADAIAVTTSSKANPNINPEDAADAVKVKVVTGFPGKWKPVILALIRISVLLGLIGFGLWVLFFMFVQSIYGSMPYFVWPGSATGVFLHSAAGFVWLITGGLQFIEAIRHRYPAFHRMSGYVFVVSNLLSATGLIILMFAQHETGVLGIVISLTFTTLWVLYLFFALRYAMQRNIYEHRIWMTRSFIMGCSAIFQRILHVMEAYVFQSGAGYYVGPMYDAICSSNATFVTAQTDYGEQPVTWDQVTMGCQGIDGLYGLYTLTNEFWWSFAWIGFVGTEIWLYIRHRDGIFAPIVNQFYKGSDNEYDVVVAGSFHTNLHVLRHTENLRIRLVHREKEGNAVRIRFALPHPNLCLHIPPTHFVNVSVPGVNRPRPYTPINNFEAGHLSFLVKRVPGGSVSEILCDKLNLGETVSISGPFGHARLYAPATYTHVVLIGASTGIAPLLTLLEPALQDPLDMTKFEFILVGRKEEDLCSRLHLESLAANHSKRMSLSIVLSGPADSAAWTSGNSPLGSNLNAQIRHFAGRLNDQDLLSSVLAEIPTSASTLVLVCGRPLFNINVKKAAGNLGYNRCKLIAVGTDDR